MTWFQFFDQLAISVLITAALAIAGAFLMMVQ